MLEYKEAEILSKNTILAQEKERTRRRLTTEYDELEIATLTSYELMEELAVNAESQNRNQESSGRHNWRRDGNMLKFNTTKFVKSYVTIPLDYRECKLAS